MEFPVFYFKAAKIVPDKTDYVVSIGFHIIPKKDYLVQTTFLDNTYEENTFQDLFENVGKQILLRLSKTDKMKGFITMREI